MTAERMDGLWSEVERALEERRSPFEDAELAARLAGEPERERAVRRLEERLARLALSAHAARPARRGVRLATAAAAGFLALAGWFAWDRPRGEEPLGPGLRLSVRSETYEPRLARITLTRERVVAWTGAEEQP